MTTATHPPVPAHILLAHRIVKEKVAAVRATADLEHATIEAAERWAAVAALEAQYRALETAA